MINHPEASWILDDIYRGVASKEQKATLLQEFYGPEFALFKSSAEGKRTADLSNILRQSPEKRKPIMDYLHNFINQLIQKKLTGFTMLHDAMLQYFLNISPGSSEMTDYLKLIIGDTKEEEIDLLKNLAFTKPGSRIVCLALAHGTAKDRKLILRAYNETISMLAEDPNGHAILVAAYEVVDDTRETSKRIFSELVSLTKEATNEGQQEKILPLSENLIGRIPLLYPFAGAAKWLVNKQETQELIKEIISIRTTTSKKAPETRQLELVTTLSQPLLSTIADNAEVLVRSSYGCQFVSEVLLDAVGDKAAAVSAIAALASGDPTAEEHVSKSATAGRMLKTLIAGGHFNPKEKRVIVTDSALGFHNQLYSHIKPFIKEWATGESSFVVVALLEADGFEHKAELRKTLTRVKGDLEGAAKKKAVSEKENEEDAEAKNKKRKKTKDVERKNTGNAGARMLLDMLKA
jgi:pumilio family protein 6